MRLIRLFFSKTDEAAYISHLDLQRVMARSLRRSGLPVWYSMGFNPHIYMTFSLPLPLMQQSLAETMDCKTEAEDEDFSRFIQPLNAALPKGIKVSQITTPVHKAEEIAFAEYCITYPGKQAELAKAAAQYNTLETAMVTRKTKRSEQQVNLKETLPSLAPSADKPDSLLVKLPAGSQVNFNPELLTKLLETATGLPAEQAQILRLQVFLADGQVFS